MAFSGPLPLYKVTSNSFVNGLAGGVINSAIGGVVNVALGPKLGQQVTGALGLPSPSSPDFLGSIVTPGLISSGTQALNQVLTDSIVNSGALGPAGPLVAGLAERTINNLAGDLLNSLNPLSTGGKGAATRYFPGAGDEEDANYQGKLYTPGAVGPDIVFSIKPAQSTASTEANSQVSGQGAGVAATTGANEVPAAGAAAGANSIPNTLSPSAESNQLRSLYSAAYDGKLQLSVAGPDSGKWLLANPETITGKTGNYADGAYVYLNPNSGTVQEQLPPGQSGPVPPYLPVQTGRIPDLGGSGFFNVAAGLKEITLGSIDPTTTFKNVGNVAGPPNATPAATEGWKFTTAPADITWDSAAKVDRVPIFGTNQPPVTSGSRGMRDLSMSNALIEGFSMLKSVEGKVAKLEALLNYTLNTSYVKVPVYWVTAEDKKYGNGNNDGGYFVIKQIKVKEELRDLSGNTTRAMVDVAFTQVPAYQVDDGRDQASKSIAGGKSIIGKVDETLAKQTEELARRGLLTAPPGTNPPSAANPPNNPGPNWVLDKNGVWRERTYISNGKTWTFNVDTGKYESTEEVRSQAQQPPAPRP